MASRRRLKVLAHANIFGQTGRNVEPEARRQDVLVAVDEIGSLSEDVKPKTQFLARAPS